MHIIDLIGRDITNSVHVWKFIINEAPRSKLRSIIEVKSIISRIALCAIYRDIHASVNYA